IVRRRRDRGWRRRWWRWRRRRGRRWRRQPRAVPGRADGSLLRRRHVRWPGNEGQLLRRLQMRPLRRALSAITGVIAALAGCHAPSASDAPTHDASAIAYRLAWSWEGARRDDARGGYAFRTDRGYDVRLDAAYVGVASIELVPCKVARGENGGVLEWLAP